MITKAKKLTFTTSDGSTCDSVEEAKKTELLNLAHKVANTSEPASIIGALVSQPREAIAILRFGLPRKPRTVKGKVGRPRKPNPAPVVTNPTKA